MQLPRRHFAVLAILLLSTGFSSPLAAETDTTTQNACVSNPKLADAGFDFTAHLDRWGQKKESIIEDDERRVRKIYINPLPIFDVSDPDEDYRLYRWANDVHYTTRKPVIRKLLLFKTGQMVDERTLDETERVLRDQTYIADAKIRVVSECGDDVDLEVITREVWTLLPKLSVKASGGNTSWTAGIQDSNFLGLGKRVTFGYSSDIERDSWELHYKDVNFLGEHKLLRIHWAESSDGYERLVQVAQPFYELDSRRSWEIAAQKLRLDQSEYELGDKIAAVTADRNFLQVSRGFSPGLVDDMARRYTFGMTVDHTAYSPPDTEPLLTSGLPDDLNLTYPWFEYSNIEDDYIVAYNINQIDRAEDLHVGSYFRSRVGYSPTDEARLVFEGNLSDTLVSANKRLLQAGLNWQGRWNLDRSRFEDARVDFGARYYRGQTKRRSLYLGFRASLAENPRPWNRVALGGDTGMRGFPSYYQTGDTSYYFTAEERIYTDLHPLSLLNIGFALFVDAGKNWFRDEGAGSRDLLTDIGFGLRLVPSKSDKEQVIHIDFAHPLDQSLPNVDSLQITAELKRSL